MANVMGVNADAGVGTGIGIFVPDANNRKPWETGWKHCFTITITPADLGTFPKTIMLDFGTGCTGIDVHKRSGKITTIYSGPMRTSGSTALSKFDNFYFDDMKVEGIHTANNNSTAGNLIFSSTVQGGKITLPNGAVINCDRSHTWTQTEGSDTPLLPFDDKFSITGNSTGTLTYGNSTIGWTTLITDPITRKFTCPWRESGKVNFTSDNHTAVLDYGNGDCDNKATLTVNGKNIEINL